MDDGWCQDQHPELLDSVPHIRSIKPHSLCCSTSPFVDEDQREKVTC